MFSSNFSWTEKFRFPKISLISFVLSSILSRSAVINVIIRSWSVFNSIFVSDSMFNTFTVSSEIFSESCFWLWSRSSLSLSNLSFNWIFSSKFCSWYSLTFSDKEPICSFRSSFAVEWSLCLLFDSSNNPWVSSQKVSKALLKTSPDSFRASTSIWSFSKASSLSFFASSAASALEVLYSSKLAWNVEYSYSFFLKRKEGLKIKRKPATFQSVLQVSVPLPWAS